MLVLASCIAGIRWIQALLAVQGLGPVLGAQGAPSQATAAELQAPRIGLASALALCLAEARKASQASPSWGHLAKAPSCRARSAEWG